MTRRKLPENKKSQRVQKGRSPIPWRYCLLTLGCGAILVVGFFFAARQHFSSIDFGIKNSKLRQQIENLEADKRRFILAKEIALSPSEVKKAAQKFGFREVTASLGEVNQVASDVKEKIKQTVSNDSEEPKKEEKKPSKEIKKAENKTSETKEKSKPQIAKK